MTVIVKTIAVDVRVSRREGQETREASCLTSRANLAGLNFELLN